MDQDAFGTEVGHAHILEHLHAIIAHETTALSRCCSYGCRTGVTEVQAPGRLQSPVRKYRPGVPTWLIKNTSTLGLRS